MDLKRTLIKLGAILFAGLFCASAHQVSGWYQDCRQNRQEFEAVEALRGSSTAAGGLSGSADDSVQQTILHEYLAVYEANPDFVGWVSIEGTQINYPVLQSPDDPDFYLKHNFEKQYSAFGTPYMQADCDPLTSDNLLLYGHSMKDGSMFTNLKKYRSAEFYREHPLIRFDTKYSYGTYEIIAVFSTTADTGGFAYNAFVNASDAAEFDAYVAKCKELTAYEIETTAQYGDRLITLSTCEYTQNNGRMVVVAKLTDKQQTQNTAI